MGFGDYGAAERFRKLMVRLARQQVALMRPAPELGVVESINLADQTCRVLFGNDPQASEVAIAGRAPVAAGQVVRVEGLPGNRYVTDVVAAGTSGSLSQRLALYGGGGLLTIPIKAEVDLPSTYPVGLSVMQYASGSPTGPWNGISSGVILTDYVNTSRINQILYQGNKNRICTRYGHGNAWGPWVELYHSGNDHSADHSIAGESANAALNFDLTSTVSVADSIVISVPSHWLSMRYILNATVQISNTSSGGAAASATVRTLSLRFGRNGSTIGPNRQHTLRNVPHELLDLQHAGTFTATGDQTFQLNASLNTTDNYKISTLSWSAQVIRLT